jgi:polyketide synthase 12
VSQPVIPLGHARGERADAARNREHLLEVARELIVEAGAEKVTMDGLAERACLGKGTVFRRFGTRAGIFHALLDEDESCFQQAVLTGPAPLGPGADPVPRLIAYGRERVAFMLEHITIFRATLDGKRPTPSRSTSFSPLHIRMLLGEARRYGVLDITDLDSLSVQLTAALEGPLLLALMTLDLDVERRADTRLADSWQTLIEHLCRP